ncbi:MAG TPA: hypothetical protein VFC85_00130, partial [Verrucomicrobiae bacterium]|nr:hypothetical protein [Verrucomicrobiae bacterium]
MKTPQEILLERHQAAAPKLDDIRRRCKLQIESCKSDAMQIQPATFNQQLATRNVLVSWCLGGLKKLWFELVLPSRRIWTGLATIWILIFIVNFSQRDGSQTVMAKSSPS